MGVPLRDVYHFEKEDRKRGRRKRKGNGKQGEEGRKVIGKEEGCLERGKGEGGRGNHWELGKEEEEVVE